MPSAARAPVRRSEFAHFKARALRLETKELPNEHRLGSCPGRPDPRCFAYISPGLRQGRKAKARSQGRKAQSCAGFGGKKGARAEEGQAPRTQGQGRQGPRRSGIWAERQQDSLSSRPFVTRAW